MKKNKGLPGLPDGFDPPVNQLASPSVLKDIKRASVNLQLRQYALEKVIDWCGKPNCPDRLCIKKPPQ